jgi:hypothetical protein
VGVECGGTVVSPVLAVAEQGRALADAETLNPVVAR